VKITTETLPERQVKLQIEIEDDQHAKAMEQAYKRLAPRVQIPGFRAGKAPRALIEKQIGHHRLLDEAMDILIPEAYKEAIAENDINPVAQPSVELVSHEPLVFTATIPLQPVIDLGDYHELRLPRERQSVTDEQVDESMQELRRRYGTIEPVDRAAQKGDVIRGDIRAAVDDKPIFEQEEIEYRLTDEALASLPGLADAIVGMSKGESKDATHDVDAEFEDPRLAGKTVSHHIVVGDVKEEKLAEENDEFAKQVGESFESVQALRDYLRETLQKNLDDTELRTYEALVVDALLARATIEFPQVLLDHEIEHLLEDQANLDPRDQRAQELYLERLGKSEEEVRETVRPEAELKLRRSLVLSHFAEAENISVSDEEVQDELFRITKDAGEQGMAILRLFDTDEGRATLRRSQLTRKTLTRLVELASGEAASETQVEATREVAPAAEEKPAPKPRRTVPRRTDE